MSEAKERAEYLGRRRHIRAWVRRLEKLCEDMPREVWIFVAPSHPYVMAKKPDCRTVYELPTDGMDPDAIIASVSSLNAHWDGGDW